MRYTKTSQEIYELTKTCPVSENRSDWMEAEWISKKELLIIINQEIKKTGNQTALVKAVLNYIKDKIKE